MGSIFNQFFNKDKDYRKPGKIIYQNERPNDSNSVKIRVNIYGIVQGVGFRYTTTYLAKQLGISGIVRNEADGSVYVEAKGTDDQIDTFIQELAKGPSPSAQVDKVLVTYDDNVKDYSGFGERH